MENIQAKSTTQPTIQSKPKRTKWGPLPCSLCIHPKRKEIDELLKDKSITGAEVAKTYDLPPGQVQIHRRKHLGIVFYYRNKKKILGSFGPASNPIIQPNRSLTQLERSLIRENLEEFFDPERGTYSNNLSDQKIGEKLNIPWKYIFNIRESAYGPIREQEKEKNLELINQLTKTIDELNKFLKILKNT